MFSISVAAQSLSNNYWSFHLGNVSFWIVTARSNDNIAGLDLKFIFVVDNDSLQNVNQCGGEMETRLHTVEFNWKQCSYDKRSEIISFIKNTGS